MKRLFNSPERSSTSPSHKTFYVSPFSATLSCPVCVVCCLCVCIFVCQLIPSVSSVEQGEEIKFLHITLDGLPGLQYMLL